MVCDGQNLRGDRALCYPCRIWLGVCVLRRELQPFTSSLFPLRFPKEPPEGQMRVYQTTSPFFFCLLSCGSVWRPQPPAPHRSWRLCESSWQKSGRRLRAVPLTVCPGQCHPGSRQWQQAHPIQVSDSSARRMG